MLKILCMLNLAAWWICIFHSLFCFWTKAAISIYWLVSDNVMSRCVCGQPYLHSAEPDMCDSVGYWNSKKEDICNLIATNRKRNKLSTKMEGWRLGAHCLYLSVQASGILMQHILAWLSWGVSGMGREEQHRCVAHSYAHPLAVPAHVFMYR